MTFWQRNANPTPGGRTRHCQHSPPQLGLDARLCHVGKARLYDRAVCEACDLSYTLSIVHPLRRSGPVTELVT